MGMTINEICYRLQAMNTMCVFQDAVGHDLSHEEIGLYIQAKDEAISIIKKYKKIEQIIKDDWKNGLHSGATLNKIEGIMEDGDDDK